MSATRTTRLDRPWTWAQAAPVCSAGCVPRGEGMNMIRSASPRRPRASHPAVPAHRGQSGEAAPDCWMRIADGHFISLDAEAPQTRCLCPSAEGSFPSFNASPRA